MVTAGTLDALPVPGARERLLLAVLAAGSPDVVSTDRIVETLWNGNRERPLHSFFTNPDENIIRWEMKTHGKWRHRMPEVERDHPALHVVRLRRPREVEAWLRGPAAAVR